jgi:hypothetical protein
MDVWNNGCSWMAARYYPDKALSWICIMIILRYNSPQLHVVSRSILLDTLYWLWIFI